MPEWYQKVKSEDTTGLVQSCFFRTLVNGIPETGDLCFFGPKICYFGSQVCGRDDSSSPDLKCLCDESGEWDCEEEICEVEGCRSASDCEDESGGGPDNFFLDSGLCFAEDDPFCGICFQDNPCQSADDCLNANSDFLVGPTDGTSLVCDDRRVICGCSGAGKVCNAPCTSSTECGLGDTCDLEGGGVCTLTPCETDEDCIDQYGCLAEKVCNRRTCTSDTDCAADDGYCVKGKCYKTLGFCSPPPP